MRSRARVAAAHLQHLGLSRPPAKAELGADWPANEADCPPCAPGGDPRGRRRLRVVVAQVRSGSGVPMTRNLLALAFPAAQISGPLGRFGYCFAQRLRSHRRSPHPGRTACRTKQRLAMTNAWVLAFALVRAGRLRATAFVGKRSSSGRGARDDSSWAIASAPAVGVIVSLDTLDSILSKRWVMSRSAAGVCWDAATELMRRGARCCVCGWAGSLGVAREPMAASAQDREPVPALPYSLDGAAVVRARAVDSRFPSEGGGSSARSRLSVLPPGGLLGALG